MDYSIQLAETALKIGAIKVNAKEPFIWASGARMPVYNDNRRLLGHLDHRNLVAEGLKDLMQTHSVNADVVAGCATAGIPHATTLANLMNKPLIYVRPEPKSHGMKNQIEGPLESGQKVVVVEDLISTGGSALKVVKALREFGAVVDDCICIFNYGFPKAKEQFQNASCNIHSLLSFPSLLEYFRKTSAMPQDQIDLLETWYPAPFDWAKHAGFE